MFKKILIANRGEIACRIIKTCKRLGLPTVAVYSDADRDGLHVEMADEAVHIGEAPAAKSYLLIERIIGAARATGSDAVHPGFGFLSERAPFAAALAEAGITFIGPNVRAISAMGDKIESKKLAKAAGVSTVPGVLGAIKDVGEAIAIARDIGFPVMIKASAGGGGKGMRIAHSEAEMRLGLEGAMNEARSAFGDDRVFIEKYVTEPRHIEIQVLGDKHGNVIHLGERECSIQRRHQKVIEEAPSPFMTEEVRKAMGAQAVALAKAVQYDSAGTVEFIMDQSRNFYFLEMNTRLQVEHPVTELVTGIDLVEQMIRVAAGERLALRQTDVELKGAAVEVRLYAEDPYRNFLPSTGRLVRFRPPKEGHHDGLITRIDTGVTEGSEISIYYDPMIAKLVTHGPGRIAAIDHMARALDAFDVAGIRHNIPFLSAVMRNARFRSGRLSTRFIEDEFGGGFRAETPTGEERERFLAAAAFIHARRHERARRLSGQLRPGHSSSAEGRWVFSADGQSIAAEIEARADGVGLSLPSEDGKIRRLQVTSSWRIGEPVFQGLIGHEPVAFRVAEEAAGLLLERGGLALRVTIDRPAIASLRRLMPEKRAADTSRFLLCPMPGILVSLAVAEAQEVKAGEPLAIVEAMKMENVLRAERDGRVVKIHARPGTSLAVDEIILEFAEAS